MKIKLYIICCMALVSALLLTACRTGTTGAPENAGSQSDTASVSAGSLSTEASTDGASSGTASMAAAENTSTASVTSTAAVSSSKANPTASPAAHIHNWSRKTVAATCTEQGYTLKSCACGASEKENYVKALGHNWSAWATVKAATTTETGRQERTCSRCKTTESKALDKLPATAADWQQEVFALVNAERAKQGLAPLTYYSAAQSAADIRVQEIITQFSHTRPDGSSCFTVLEELGIKYWMAGENIAYGQRSPEQVMQSWMKSEGHRANILKSDFNAIVVGYKDNRWVQLFLKI